MIQGKKKAERKHSLWKLGLIIYLAFTAAAMNFPLLSVAKESKVNEFRLGYSLKTLHDVDMKDASAALAIWSKEIGRTKGFYVESKPYDEPLQLFEDIQSRKLDFGIFRSEDFVRLGGRLSYDTPLAVQRSGKKTHRYLVIVRSDASIKEFKDLRNKTACFLRNDEASRIFVDSLISKQKIQSPGKFFSDTQEKQKASQVVLSVLFGQADVGITNDTSYQTMVDMNPQVSSKLRILVSSPEYVAGLGVFRKGYNKEAKEEVLDSLFSLSDTPRGKQVLMLFKGEKFVPLEESELDNIRKLITEYDRSRTRK